MAAINQLPPVTDMRSTISKYLQEGQYAHLSSCLDLVQDGHISAVYRMIMDARTKHIPRPAVARMVSDDIGAFVATTPEHATHSLPFIKC